MAVSTQVIRFQKDTSGTTNATQDVTLNFTPKAIIVFSDGNNANNIVSDHYQMCYGFSDGTNHACTTIVSDDADAAADNCMSTRNDSVFVRMLESFTTATVQSRATCAFATNKVTFTWVVNDTTATYITIYAFGGSDITNAKVNTVTVATTSIGTQNYTGLGFTPTAGTSVLFTMGTFVSSTGEIDYAGLGFGAASSATARFYTSVLSENAADPTDTWRNHLDAYCLGILNSVGNLLGLADFNGWVTDGFQLDWNPAPTTSTYLFSYLVIKGGHWDAGNIDSPAATGSQNTSVSVNSNTIKGLLIGGTGQVTPSVTSSTVNTITVGASDGTNESVVANIDEDAAANADAYRVNEITGNVVRLLTTNGANSAVAAFTSFGTNQFTINWSAVSSGATFGWVIVADQPTAQLYEKPISETSVSVSETLARVQVKLNPISETAITVSESLTKILAYTKTISDPSISVSETLTRIQTRKFIIPETGITTNDLVTGTSTQQYDRPISEPSVSISEELARIQTLIKTISDTPAITVSEQLTSGLAFIKTISESTINTNDTIVRLPLYLRPIINESAISVNDSIARWISVSYTLAEPSITVNDSIAGALFYLRQISESAINTNDSIVRLLAAVRTISDPPISINDTIARIQTLLKTITNEDAISINDSLQAGLLLTISLIESRIKWYYSLLTRKITP